ncbi:MAG TPA: hypothetical protein DCE44_02105 [Verrucomicrobiales bacterium]|nr:hypothetical protein [Verrucomicrobiales bacterium]
MRLEEICTEPEAIDRLTDGRMRSPLVTQESHCHPVPALPGRAAVPRRPRAKGAALRSDVLKAFDASLRKSGPELRSGQGQRSAPSLLLDVALAADFDDHIQVGRAPRETCLRAVQP